ncbi:MAG: stage III sporulation protein D [Ruminococcaceae bacterium]|nr:stage III sporulation protein D [Oscillospiraceae bacterium]
MQNFDSASRPEQLGYYITRNKATVRETAAYFGISKSTVHKDVTVELAKQNCGLYSEVNEILQQNKKERHLRGGEATRKKYEAAKNRGRQ